MYVPEHDYYQILGVSPLADAEAIKRAYRARACAVHPDRNPEDPGAAERFRQLQEAYAVLGTPERRRAYDSRGEGGRAGTPLFTLKQEGSPEELFCSAFAPPPPDPVAPLHLRLRVPIGFECALRGGRKMVDLPGGELVRVTIPRGCRDGTTVRVRGKGKEGRGGLRGDLFVTFRVEPHPRYRREGNHLHIVERVSALEAMVGTERAITNPYGHVIRVTIPPGTQPGERFRVRGQGVATSAGTGDLFVEVDVEVPKALSEEQRTRLREAARGLGLL